jgi:hypothetical protein
MRGCIQQINGWSQQFKNWESLSWRAGWSTPHPIATSSRRFPVLLLPVDVCGRAIRRTIEIEIGVTGTDPGRVIASPRIGAHWGAKRPMTIHVGSSKARLKRNSGASPGNAVGGAGTFDDMVDR